MVSKGNHLQMALIQASEILYFTQTCEDTCGCTGSPGDVCAVEMEDFQTVDTYLGISPQPDRCGSSRLIADCP